ncbi:aminoglycoside phosphotransferase family protein [Amycolatopsis sp. FBCC-B4732]|uniref:aminoglycoside phosphotransferase family protein n=1 Tax=Amycolatopsis sp. FBCC-B4732 TaxID=3079339 RepID=UPI001FF3040D|nr:aminoglycoside phosphotransferase family protein [Amycolatopsis sp. FBCC-B4732]UOX91264.1 aminoglycoside phosphotransferase family protein [Amycolatopsis sp. FBCC-B4732]
MVTGDLSSGEATITLPVVRQLIDTQFPRWAHLPLEPAPSQGVDNATYRLGPELSVRLPRYARWTGQVAREQEWLPKLAPHLPLPVPVPLAEGKPGAGYPFPWSVLRWLPGDAVDPDTGTAGELAGFFAVLQRIDATGGPQPQWSNGFRGVAMTDERDSAIAPARLAPRIEALAGLIDLDAVAAVWEAARAAPPWAGPPVWIHGDPAPGNLLAREGRVSAVIDFGTLAVGDPACDLIVAWSVLSAAERREFRAELDIDDATWARGRGWGLTAVLPTRAELTGPTAARARRRLDELVADHRMPAVRHRASEVR